MKPKFKIGEIVIQTGDILTGEYPVVKIIKIRKKRYKDMEYGYLHVHIGSRLEECWVKESSLRKATKREIKECLIDQL